MTEAPNENRINNDMEETLIPQSIEVGVNDNDESVYLAFKNQTSEITLTIDQAVELEYALFYAIYLLRPSPPLPTFLEL